MVGAIARQSIMSNDPGGLVIGYREVTSLRDTLLTHQGEVVRGHEFHYSCLNAPFAREDSAYELPTIKESPARSTHREAQSLSPRQGDRGATYGQVEGFARGNLLATYVHLSFSGFPLAAQRFVTSAKLWQMHSDLR